MISFIFVFLQPKIVSAMIQEIKVKNFLSFKDEVTFSFEATKDTFAEDYQVVEVTPGVRILRFAMVYGANASGKSNLLQAMAFLRYFFFYQPENANEGTRTEPFLLDKATPSQPSEFELVFYAGETKYWYTLKLDTQQVYEEKLYIYKSVQPTLLFHRELNDGMSVIHFNPAAIRVSAAEREKISLECLRNMSVFAARDKVNTKIPDLDLAKNWLKSHLMPVIEPGSNLFGYAEQRNMEKALLHTHIIDFMREADFNISDVTTEIVSNAVPDEYINYILNNEDIPAQEKERMMKERTIKQRRTLFEHTVKDNLSAERYTMNQYQESAGTIRTFGIETAIYECINSESFLAIDEMECSLHPQLVKFILLNFLRNKSRSQLLVTTHYDPLLNEVTKQNDQRIFRKDSVWFTEKLPSGHTDVYSLAEFRGLNRLSSIQKAYNQGNFGAFPQINL